MPILLAIEDKLSKAMNINVPYVSNLTTYTELPSTSYVDAHLIVPSVL